MDGTMRPRAVICDLAVGVVVWLVTNATSGNVAAAETSPAAAFAGQGVAFLKKYCLDCHAGPSPKADLALDGYREAASLVKSRRTWDGVVEMIRSGVMPPDDRPQPAPAESDAFLGLVRAVFDEADRTAPPDPGRVTMRRLNRTEYRNTIRDLLGVDFDPTESFPADDIGHGFDNIGDVMTVSPVLLERYLAAAESIVQRTLILEGSRDTGPASPRRLLAAAPGLSQAEQTREILTRFTSWAYRRPATTEEIDRLVRLTEQAQAGGEKWEGAIGLAVQAVLVSPKFLFRVELDNDPESPRVQPLDEYPLASRLSYFLWSSMPDDELFALAQRKQLTANLESQVRRMLQDPKSQALVDNFALQWLQLQRLETFMPDPQMFPTFNDRLRAAMLEETKRFFGAILREDRSLLDLIDADFTFLNEPLARHYGIVDTRGTRIGQQPAAAGGQPIRGEEFVRVQLADAQRGGLLTQASVLTVTSNPTRTSPVKRGRWVLEQILGTPPPPPPPNVPEFPQDQQSVASGSLRQRFEQHRADPSCANCHARMDPIGFALENFDAIGRFRTQDGEFPIDPSGELPDGSTFRDYQELKQILGQKRDAVTRCLTEKLLIYALGRGLEYYDAPTVERIGKTLAAQEYRFSTLVVEIVGSEPFRMRRGELPMN